MPDQPSHRPSEVRPNEIVQALHISGTIRWIAPWAWFVLALALGRVLTGQSAIQVDELVFGLPLSWLVGWIAARDMKVASVAAGAVIVAAGLAIGLLAQ